MGAQKCVTHRVKKSAAVVVAGFVGLAAASPKKSLVWSRAIRIMMMPRTTSTVSTRCRSGAALASGRGVDSEGVGRAVADMGENPGSARPIGERQQPVTRNPAGWLAFVGNGVITSVERLAAVKAFELPKSSTTVFVPAFVTAMCWALAAVTLK